MICVWFKESTLDCGYSWTIHGDLAWSLGTCSGDVTTYPLWSCRWQWLPRVNWAVLQSDSFSPGLNITEGNCNSLMPLQSQLRTQGVLGLQEGPFTSFSQLLLPPRDCSKTGISVSNLLTLHEHLNLRRWLTAELRVEKKEAFKCICLTFWHLSTPACKRIAIAVSLFFGFKKPGVALPINPAGCFFLSLGLTLLGHFPLLPLALVSYLK